MKILLIDNYDSFTHNLAHLLNTTLKCNIQIIKHDHMDKMHIDNADFIVISPGPGHPNEYKYETLFANTSKPILGICLGMQILNISFGGSVNSLKNCQHGTTQYISFGKNGIKSEVAIYNSLFCSNISNQFAITAKTKNNIPMAIEHKTRPYIGYQFHPESFLTKNGEYFINYAFNHFFKNFNK